MLAFAAGKLTHARLNRLKGYNALTEFLVSWTEGIFVFRHRATSEELDDNCMLKESLDRMLIDSAHLQDQLLGILSNLPSGRATILERVWNFEALWAKLAARPLKYVDDTLVREQDKPMMLELASLVDGLSTLDEIIASFDIWPSHLIIKSIHLLIEHRLVNIQQASFTRPLSIFQRIVAELEHLIGKDENKALLAASLHYVHGESTSATRFHIDQEGRVSLNLSQVKRSGTPVSALILELRRWMEAYLAYCRRKIEPEVVDRIVATIINAEVSYMS